MLVTVIATGFPGMNGEFVPSQKAQSFIDNSDAMIDAFTSTAPAKPAVQAKNEEDNFADIMSIFGKK